MKIISEKSKYHRFALYYDYRQDRVDFCKSLKDTFGFKEFSFAIDGNMKRWVFTNSIIVPVLKEHFPELAIDPIVQKIVENEQAWSIKQSTKGELIDEIKLKKDTDFKVDGLKKQLYPYQKVGVEFLEMSGGKAIIADAPGLGKTAQALAYCSHKGFKRILAVSPASVKFAWANEVKKWTNLTSIVIDSKTDLSKIDPKINVWVINYDILKKHYPVLTKVRFDCMIGDECHLVKSTTAMRTKAFRAISRDIPSILLLSGTPLLSRPSELYSLLNIIDPSTWKDWYDFARKYCDAHQTRWGLDTSGVSNSTDLHSRIRRYFIRRDKMEVLKELPPKTFINLPVQLPYAIQKEYNTAANNLAQYLYQYQGKQSGEIAKALEAEKLAQLNVLRQLSSRGKMETAIELAENIIESGEKVLIFCSFIGPLDEIKAHFKDKAVMITGKTPVEERGNVVEAFQNDKSVKVFLGGIKSAGVGITLTAASNVIFLDYSWNPADMQQAQDRVHRIGQVASSVNIYQLEAIGTIDEDLKGLLEHKQDIFNQIIEGKVAESIAQNAVQLATNRIMNDYGKK